VPCCNVVKLLEEYETAWTIEDEFLLELFEHWQGLQVGFSFYLYVVYASCTNIVLILWNTYEHVWGSQLKLIIDLNSLNIHLVSKITQYVQKKKEASHRSATDSRGMKPKILGACSMANLSVVPHLITVLNFDRVETPLDMLL